MKKNIEGGIYGDNNINNINNNNNEDKMNIIDIDNINVDEKQRYFSMELIDISLRTLRLKRYTFPIITHRNQPITPLTNPLPCFGEFGDKPNKTRYTDPELVKCWNEEHHLGRFEKALYHIVKTKEILIKYSKLMDHYRNEQACI